MPGRPFQSSLEPHLETIRALRLKRSTWQQVADTLAAEHGLKISPWAILKFFKRRVHPTARQPLGFPSPATTTSGHAAPVAAPLPAASEAQDAVTNTTPAAAAMPPPRKEYVFVPKPKKPSLFSDEDLQFNDPLAIDTFGKPVPVEPDAENPFKMRKRKNGGG